MCRAAPAELFRDEVDDFGHERLEHVDHEHARQSPQHRELQTHVALDVQRTLGVVPPLVVEHLFEHPAGEVFDGAREQHAAAEQQPEAALERPEYEQHAHDAEAVDRADGAVDEAAVDKLAVRDGGEGHLGAPAEKTVNVEVPEDLEPGIGHKHEKTPLMNACGRETRIDFVFVYINIAMRTFPVFSARMGTKSAKW